MHTPTAEPRPPLVENATGPRHDLDYTYSGDRLATAKTTGTGTGPHPQLRMNDRGAPHRTSAIERLSEAGNQTGLPAGQPTSTMTRSGRATNIVGGQRPTTTPTTPRDNTPAPAGTSSTSPPQTPTMPEKTVASGSPDASHSAPHGNITTTVWLGNGTEITRTSPATPQLDNTFTHPQLHHPQRHTPGRRHRGQTLAEGTLYLAAGPGTWPTPKQHPPLHHQHRHLPTPQLLPLRRTHHPNHPHHPHPTTTAGNRGYLNQTHDRSGDIRLDHRNYTPGPQPTHHPDPLPRPKRPTDAESLRLRAQQSGQEF